MKALIADDDKLLSMIMEKQLRGWGFDAVVANDGNEAFKLITESDEPPRIALIDWEMPGLNGVELCRKLRAMETNDPIYIILVTGHTDTDHIATALQSGANDFLSKPTKAVELRARLGVGLRTLELQRRLNIANEMLAYKAEHDELTTLRNRGSIIDHLDIEIARSQRTGAALAVAICDIDFFKRVNDTYGHPVGDRVLKEFADRMKETFRPYDLLGRYGGEEFLVACELEGNDAFQVFDRFRQVIANAPFLANDLSLDITVSIGVKVFTGEPGSLKTVLLEVISEADTALYAAKHEGRNKVVLSSETNKSEPTAEADEEATLS